jgi:hypothetical protein
MQRFRSTWLALLGGAFLAALSVSAALGVDPGSNRGQIIAAFVHEIVFGGDEATDDELIEGDQDGELDVDAEPEEELAGADGDDVSLERVEGSAHGQCVSDIAQDESAVGGANENHGGAVSQAAGDTCWEPADEVVTEPEDDGEGANAHGECVSAVAQDKEALGGPNDNHGGAVSEAARETCRDTGGEETEGTGDAELTSATEATEGSGAGAGPGTHGNGPPAGKPNGNGGGHGRGGGRP